MKAFLVGFLFLCVVLIFASLGVLLFPLLFVLTFFLRVFIGIALILFAIWLLGKIILFLLESLDKKSNNGPKQV